MAKIDVIEKEPQVFEVVVEAASTTRHRVTVDRQYAAEIAPGVELLDLVRRSFEFLLERESNTSILAEFDLAVIARYFPEYERTIGA